MTQVATRVRVSPPPPGKRHDPFVAELDHAGLVMIQFDFPATETR